MNISLTLEEKVIPKCISKKLWANKEYYAIQTKAGKNNVNFGDQYEMFDAINLFIPLNYFILNIIININIKHFKIYILKYLYNYM